MTLNPNEIRQRAEAIGPWYHPIKLLPDFTTRTKWGNAQDPVWQATRDVRSRIDYKGKTVLDIASLEGMWAFEAEELGAKTVIASDIYQNGGQDFYERFCFAKFVRNSRVCLLPNIDIHDLQNRLDSIFRAWEIGSGFDIIQCTGLLYHVQHPLLAIRQMRHCCNVGASLILETACTKANDSTLRFNYDKTVYDDETTYWVPSERCLKEMVALCGFRYQEGSMVRKREDRVAMLAIAEPFEDREKKYG